MRFTVAWANVLSQNLVLRWLLIVESILCMVLGTGLMLSVQRPPFIIERACFSKVIGTTDDAHTTPEMKAFVTEALLERYDTTVGTQDLLSADERTKALKEREDMRSKQITQRLVINNIDIKNDKIAVDADRIVAVDTIRTAFRLPVEITVGATARSQRNPYGLILVTVTEIK